MQENLWNFAVQLYEQPNAAPLFLTWQERFGADINLLLAGFWLAAQRRVWSADELRALLNSVNSWREYAILPLRATRRALAASTLYPVLKTIELDAERVQLNMVANELGDRPIPLDLLPLECARRNLWAYASTLRDRPDAAGIDVLLAVGMRVFPAPNREA